MTNGPTTTGEPHPAAYWSITEDHTSVPVAVSKAHTRASGPRFVTKTSPLATAGLAVIVRPVWVVHFTAPDTAPSATTSPAAVETQTGPWEPAGDPTIPIPSTRHSS